MPSPDLLIRDADTNGTQQDCRIVGGTIVELGTDLSAGGAQILHAAGAVLLPGLADHHIHLLATAAAARSIDLAGATVLPARTPDDSTAWLRIIGAGRMFERSELDAVWPDRPVRVQHRSGALWMLNSVGVMRLGHLDADQRRTGHLWRADHQVRSSFDDDEQIFADVSDVAGRLLRMGITHLTDATPDLDARTIDRLGRAVPQHLVSLAESGAGPRKIVVADHDLPDPDALIAQVAQTHADGRPVAVHAVTAATLALSLAAFDGAGVLDGDRIEHAAVCDDHAAARIADLGITVVTQPTIWARHRSAFVAESEPQDRPWLWRYAGLIRAGVHVVASSDAPYGDADPWRTIADAVRGEAKPPDAVEVLDGLLREPLDLRARRRVSVGRPADLVLLVADSIDSALADAVATRPIGTLATIVGGTLYPTTA